MQGDESQKPRRAGGTEAVRESTDIPYAAPVIEKTRQLAEVTGMNEMTGEVR
jgi:hypothetical protein